MSDQKQQKGRMYALATIRAQTARSGCVKRTNRSHNVTNDMRRLTLEIVGGT